KFDTTGGSEVKNVSVKSGQTIGSIQEPKKNGFVFTGWYSDEELSDPYSADEKITKSTTLYAGWKVDPVRQITLTIGKTEAKVWNESKSNDVAPIIRNDRTMLPARFVTENLGATVEWIGEEQKVLITKDDMKIEIYIDSDKAYVNGEEVILDSPAFIENDRTYTPVRFIAETLGVTVDWDEETQQVIITKAIEE
ncbi:MAG: InlB B-repeat-containing protein, partial [Clostridia bacterium]|nr:InlB B-repeat-containing protein [Clostridia bacterium]